MGIISWIVFGLIAGAIAKLIMPGEQGGGWIVTIILGIIGAALGGWIGSMVFNVGVDGFNIKSLIVAVVGALIVLAIYGFVAGRSHRV